ncbi:MAG: hypothetical protein IPL32_17960 [Chloracidobacterium sp.]|nr:hypothetical protein [Chloracidobacterium sp.]
MALESFNVFGQIVFTKEDFVITAIAYKGNQSIERTFKFHNRFAKDNAGTTLLFTAQIKKRKPYFYLTRRRAIDYHGKDADSLFVNTSDVEDAIGKTLEFIHKADMSAMNDPEPLRPPSAKGSIDAYKNAVKVSTDEGEIIVDLDLAKEILKKLPEAIKKASN